MRLLRMILSGVLITLSALNAQAGTINGQIQTASGGPVRNGTLTLTLNQVANVPGVAQVVAQQVQCFSDNFGNLVGEPDQTTAPSASVNLGSGTLAAGTYFVKTALQDASGVSNVSPEASFTLSAPGTLIVTAPGVQPANASGFRIYIGTASGNETLQGTVTGTPGSWANFSQAAALSAGSAMPVANTTVCTFAFQDSMIPTTTYYTINLVNAGGSKIAGYPVSQVRFYGGTNGSVNVSNGWPMSIGGVVYPSPIVSTPAANAEQSISSNLNLNGFALKAGPITASGNVATTPALGATGGALNVQKTTGGTAIYNARVLDSFGNTNQQIIGFDVEQLINPSSNVNYLTFGQVTEVAIPTSNTANFTGGDQTATYGSVSDFGSGTINSISGITGEGFNAGSATATLVKGASGTANCGGVVVNGIPGQTQTPTNNGNCANLRAIDGVANNRSSGTVTNGAAFYAEAPSNTGGGTFTNAYGLFVADQTAATNNFAIKTGLGKVSFGDTVAVGLWNSVRVVDGTRFTTINAAENDCSTANCIVIIPSTFACGSGQNLAAKDNITVWDFRQCSSPQSTSGHLFYSVKDTNNGAVRDKMMLVDSFTPTNDMSASSSSASFYTHAFAEGNLNTFATLEAINGTITVDTGATNSPAAVVGIEGEAFVSGTVANTLTDVRGATFNAGLTGAGSVTNATDIVAQAVTNTGSGTVSNAVGFKCEAQTVGTVSNLCLWAQGVSAFDKPFSVGSFSGGVVPQPGVGIFVRSNDLTGATQAGLQSVPITTSAATGVGVGIRARADTAAAVFAQGVNQGLRVDTPTVGAGSSIGEWDGVDIEAAPTAGTKCSIKMAGSTSGSTCVNTSAVAGGTAAPIISTSFTTTAATTDNVTVTGMTSTGHCALEPTNSGAAGGIASVFVSAKAANQITVTHTATSGWTFDVMCSPI